MVSCQQQIGLLLTIICLLYIDKSASQNPNKPCTFGVLDECGDNEACEQSGAANTTGSCVCIRGYDRLGSDKKCQLVSPTLAPDAPGTVSPEPSKQPVYDSSHVIIGILIPLFLVSLAMGLVYAGKRYQWIQRLRAMRQRRYDEVQFGQEEDDPPLA